MPKQDIDPKLADRNLAGEDAPKIKRPSKIFTEYYSSIILILITLLISGGYLVIKPKIDEYKALRSNIDNIKQNIENQQSYLAGISRSVSAAESISPQVLARVDRALPRSFSIPETIVLLNRAAETSSIEVSSIVFSPGNGKSETGKKTDLQSMQMTINVTTPNYQSLKLFLNALEISLRLFDVQMITISDFKEGKASFSLQLRTYYFAGSSANP